MRGGNSAEGEEGKDDLSEQGGRHSAQHSGSIEALFPVLNVQLRLLQIAVNVRLARDKTTITKEQQTITAAKFELTREEISDIANLVSSEEGLLIPGLRCASSNPGAVDNDLPAGTGLLRWSSSKAVMTVHPALAGASLLLWSLGIEDSMDWSNVVADILSVEGEGRSVDGGEGKNSLDDRGPGSLVLKISEKSFDGTPVEPNADAFERILYTNVRSPWVYQITYQRLLELEIIGGDDSERAIFTEIVEPGDQDEVFFVLVLPAHQCLHSETCCTGHQALILIAKKDIQFSLIHIDKDGKNYDRTGICNIGERVPNNIDYIYKELEEFYRINDDVMYQGKDGILSKLLLWGDFKTVVSKMHKVFKADVLKLLKPPPLEEQVEALFPLFDRDVCGYYARGKVVPTLTKWMTTFREVISQELNPDEKEVIVKQKKAIYERLFFAAVPRITADQFKTLLIQAGSYICFDRRAFDIFYAILESHIDAADKIIILIQTLLGRGCDDSLPSFNEACGGGILHYLVAYEESHVLSQMQYLITTFENGGGCENLAAVKLFLKRSSDQQDRNNRTPLSLACQMGLTKCVAALLIFGVRSLEPVHINPINKLSPLQHAMLYGFNDIVTLIVQNERRRYEGSQEEGGGILRLINELELETSSLVEFLKDDGRSCFCLSTFYITALFQQLYINPHRNIRARVNAYVTWDGLESSALYQDGYHTGTMHLSTSREIKKLCHESPYLSEMMEDMPWHHRLAYFQKEIEKYAGTPSLLMATIFFAKLCKFSEAMHDGLVCNAILGEKLMGERYSVKYIRMLMNESEPGSGQTPTSPGGTSASGSGRHARSRKPANESAASIFKAFLREEDDPAVAILERGLRASPRP